MFLLLCELKSIMVREYTWYVCNSIKLVDVGFMTNNTIYRGDCFMRCWKECIFH